MAKGRNRKKAIYSRKSKFTGKGESIENQVELCKRHLKNLNTSLSDDDILIFEDEGFSGKNTNRPEFQKMMNACKRNEIDTIVCYRLDRISRNVKDFSILIEEFEELKIDFISIRDNFDTSTPTGKAMMMMCSVFAQLERETIAERIRDNLLELAKTGRWLGGITPLGYKSVAVKKQIQIDGKYRTAFKLDSINEEKTLYKILTSKFLETNSLSQTETFCLQNGFTTRNGKKFTRFSIRVILQNPVYACADMDMYEYFSNLGAVVYNEKEEFNGKHGLMVYNKTNQSSGKSHQMHDIEDWIVSIGKHQPYISGKEWIKIQEMLDQNKSKSFRKPKNNNALLSGLLICGNCGDYMRPKVNRRIDEDGNKTFSYLCSTKEVSRRMNCDINNPQGNLLDKMVCDEIKKLSENQSELQVQLKHARSLLSSSDNLSVTRQEQLNTKISDVENQIDNLLKSLGTENTSSAAEYIRKEINRLHEEKLNLTQQLNDLTNLLNNQNQLLSDFDILIDSLSSFSSSFDLMTIEEKRATLRLLVDKIVWDGKQIHIYLAGSEMKPLGADCKRNPHDAPCKKEDVPRGFTL